MGAQAPLGCVGRAGRARLSWWVQFGQEKGRQLALEEKGAGATSHVSAACRPSAHCVPASCGA